MRIIWSPLAAERVAEIAEYIAQDNPDAAEKWADTIFAKVEKLKPFPENGRIVQETRNERIRELIDGNYRVIYRIEEKHLSILTVRHGKQILPTE